MVMALLKEMYGASAEKVYSNLVLLLNLFGSCPFDLFIFLCQGKLEQKLWKIDVSLYKS